MKKILSLGLVLLSVLVVAGCRDRSTVGGEEIDYDRTQLYVSNFNGGVGTEWLYKVKTLYEELHADDVYEVG